MYTRVQLLWLMTCVLKYDKSWYKESLFLLLSKKLSLCLDIRARGNLCALHNKRKKRWSFGKPWRKRGKNQRSKGEEGERERQEKWWMKNSQNTYEFCVRILHGDWWKRPHFQHKQIEHKKETACTSPRAECREWMKTKVSGDCQKSWGVYWIITDHRTGDMETKFTSLSERCRKSPAGIPVIHPPEQCLFAYSKDTKR